jgi:alpha-L-fucosidase
MRPSLIINNRVGHSRQGMAGMSANKDAPGDFGTPEQRVPPEGLPGVDWETCMTINDTWGFQTFDDDWKDTKTLVRTLVDVASKGGNLLLNVGPTLRGEIPWQSVSRLREMGEWTRANGESVYGTSASPYGLPTWGRYTAKPATGKVYAHVFEWPKDGTLPLTGVRSAPRSVYLLADRKPLAVHAGTDGVVVQLPAVRPSGIDAVLVLESGGATDRSR